MISVLFSSVLPVSFQDNALSYAAIASFHNNSSLSLTIILLVSPKESELIITSLNKLNENKLLHLCFSTFVQILTRYISVLPVHCVLQPTQESHLLHKLYCYCLQIKSSVFIS
jgi:hypothetical protein